MSRRISLGRPKSDIVNLVVGINVRKLFISQLEVLDMGCIHT